MCDFVSWIERKVNGETIILFLTNKEIESTIGKEMGKENEQFHVDAVGHGAIKRFYGIKGGKKKEFSGGLPSTYPKEIVQAIKAGRFSRVPGAFNVRFLNTAAAQKFNEVCYKNDKLFWKSKITSKQRGERNLRLFWKLFMVKKNRATGWA